MGCCQRAEAQVWGRERVGVARKVGIRAGLAAGSGHSSLAVREMFLGCSSEIPSKPRPQWVPQEDGMNIGDTSEDMHHTVGSLQSH